MRRLSIAVCCAVLLAACARESSTPASPGCLIALGATCVTATSMTEATCAAQAGTWQGGGCPGERQLGTCATDTGTMVAYYSPWWTAASARSTCAGTWLPLPEATPPTPPPTGGSSMTVSCTYGAMGVTYGCIELIGPAEVVGGFSGDCTADYGTYAEAACSPTSKVPGYCRLVAGDPTAPAVETRVYYGTAVYTLSQAQAECTDPASTAGAWVGN